MSEGPVTCPFCHEQVLDATIIRVSVPGDGNNIQLYLCADCKEAANAGSHKTGVTLLDVLRDVILVGVRKLAGFP